MRYTLLGPIQLLHINKYIVAAMQIQLPQILKMGITKLIKILDNNFSPLCVCKNFKIVALDRINYMHN
jgi:hypothetical protein